MSLEVQIHDQFLKVAAPISADLGRAIEALGPLSPYHPSPLPLAERLCRTVAGQQLSTKAAASIWRRVEAAAKGRPMMAFVNCANPDVLRGCGLSRAKVKALGAIAEADAAGLLDVEQLKQMESQARSKQLTTIWGIGQWTADMTNMFYFCEPDIWPDGDVTACKTLLRLAECPGPAADIARNFAPFRSFLARYMWDLVDRNPEI